MKTKEQQANEMEMSKTHPVQQAHSSSPTTQKELDDAVKQLNPDKNSANSRG